MEPHGTLATSTYVCVCVRTCIIYISSDVCTTATVSTCMCVCMCAYIYVHIYVHTHCKHACMHTYTYTHTLWEHFIPPFHGHTVSAHIHTYIHTYIHTDVPTGMNIIDVKLLMVRGQCIFLRSCVCMCVSACVSVCVYACVYTYDHMHAGRS
jgi:hypothetical protein